MYRKLSLKMGKATCNKCGATIEWGRSCWATKKVAGQGYQKSSFWSYRCFQCSPSTTDPATIE